MAVINTSNTRTANGRNDNGNGNPETEKYRKFWVNIGAYTEDEENDPEGESFIRLPRGVAVSDLIPHKIYEKSDPEWAAQAKKINAIIDLIRESCENLKEGESVPLSIHARVYRAQEELETNPSDDVDMDNLRDQLFNVNR